ncbi:hypothetical protein IJG44_01105 [bacterium]|nr:hypothetical protein [bacterium]
MSERTRLACRLVILSEAKNLRDLSHPFKMTRDVSASLNMTRDLSRCSR